MNKVFMIGRITKSLELKTTQSNIPFVNFTLAVNRQFTNQDGDKETDFISCVCFRKTAENLAQFCDKGSQIAVDGRLQTRSYDTDDGTKYVVEVVCDTIQFLDTKPSEDKAPRNSRGEFKAEDVKISKPDDSSDLPF